jgi:hypothetical protein
MVVAGALTQRFNRLPDGPERQGEYFRFSWDLVNSARIKDYDLFWESNGAQQSAEIVRLAGLTFLPAFGNRVVRAECSRGTARLAAVGRVMAEDTERVGLVFTPPVNPFLPPLFAARPERLRRPALRSGRQHPDRIAILNLKPTFDRIHAWLLLVFRGDLRSVLMMQCHDIIGTPRDFDGSLIPARMNHTKILAFQSNGQRLEEISHPLSGRLVCENCRRDLVAAVKRPLFTIEPVVIVLSIAEQNVEVVITENALRPF